MRRPRRCAGATLDGLESLVNKSLMRRREGGRFESSKMIREYALDRLEESGEAGELRQLHAEYFCRFGRAGRGRAAGA